MWHQAQILQLAYCEKCPTGVASCSCAHKIEAGMSDGMKEAAETSRESHTLALEEQM